MRRTPRMKNRARPTWHDLFSREAIGPTFFVLRLGRLAVADAGDKEAKAEQYRRMVQLRDHFGISHKVGWRAWYELAVAIASEQNPAFGFVGGPFSNSSKGAVSKAARGKTTPRWRGFEGHLLVELVDDTRDALEERGIKRVTWKHIAADLASLPGYSDMSAETLKANYSSAQKHWMKIYGGEKRKK